MANVLKREKKEEILALGRLGWSIRRIAEAVGVRRETASKYLKLEGILVRKERARKLSSAQESPKPASGAEVLTDSENPKPASCEEVLTDFGAPTRSAIAKSQAAPYAEEIASGLRLGRNAMGIYQDLVEDHGYTGSYWSVLRYTKKLRNDSSGVSHPVIVTSPGEEAQVDYGTGPMVRDPKTGQYRRTRLFVFTLGYSRKSVRLLTFRSSSRIWAELHERAFLRLGGAPRIVVLDNLKEGIVQADAHDPKENPLYRDVLSHYGVTAFPCRVRHPNRKGKVESGVGHAQKTPLRGKRFESLEEAQTYLDSWEEKWADTRIHGTTKQQVAKMFVEEKPHLLPLPPEPFRYYDYGLRTVHLDSCVEVRSGYYSVPPRWIGQKVFCQWDKIWVRILCPTTRSLLREHVRQRPGRYRMHPKDRSPKTPKGTLYQLERAQKAGPHIGAFCQQLIRKAPDTGIRRVLGVFSLAKKYGTARVNKACKMAMDIGSYEYQFVKRLLERGGFFSPASLKQIDPLIRQLSEYRDFVLQTQSTKEEEK